MVYVFFLFSFLIHLEMVVYKLSISNQHFKNSLGKESWESTLCWKKDIIANVFFTMLSCNAFFFHNNSSVDAYVDL